MAHMGLKLKVTGQGEDMVGLTFILNQGQFSSSRNVIEKSKTVGKTSNL